MSIFPGHLMVPLKSETQAKCKMVTWDQGKSVRGETIILLKLKRREVLAGPIVVTRTQIVMKRKLDQINHLTQRNVGLDFIGSNPDHHI
jgi:hypothetical protein